MIEIGVDPKTVRQYHTQKQAVRAEAIPYKAGY